MFSEQDQENLYNLVQVCGGWGGWGGWGVGRLGDAHFEGWGSPTMLSKFKLCATAPRAATWHVLGPPREAPGMSGGTDIRDANSGSA